ncbi:MAG: pyridoxal phosphate-dependent decarboxylase family protein [Actinomycetes bacterium]
MSGTDDLLHETADIAAEYLRRVRERPVGPHIGHAVLAKELGGELPDGPADAATVVSELAAAIEPGLVGSVGPRYFGFVIGGGVPAAVAADWLTSVWDQNAGLYAAGPGAAVVEDVAGAWLLDLLGLPGTASVGFVTGATMANFTGLAAARHTVLDRVGWNVEAEGLVGAPKVRVVVGAERHASVDVALRYLGLGANTAEIIPVDDQGRLRVDALHETLADGRDEPLIVCAQAGNVNTGSFDPIDEICAVVHEGGGWVHVDGAFGLWAAASESLRTLVAGIDRADSWATDAHKWLNVPYDCGLVFIADPAAHHAAMNLTGSYLQAGAPGERDAYNFTPESSRRARGIPVYAALRALGRSGVASVVESCCAHARRFADALRGLDGVDVLNDVVLNQVLVRFDNDDDVTRAVVSAVQADGTCWLSGTVWQGRAAMRISVCNWSTTTDDVDQSVAAILRCYATVRNR